MDPDLPAWLASAKGSAQRSEAWSALANEVFISLRNEMSAFHVRFFSDLTGKEQLLFLEKVREKLRERPAYLNFLDVASDCCNRALRDEFRRQARSADADRGSKVDALVSTCAKGVEALLRRWPDQRERLRPLINEDLGPNLRRSAWRLFLGPSEAPGAHGPSHGRAYERAVQERRLQTVSRFDVLIAQRCQALLASRAEWGHLRGAASVGRMKSALSYLRVQRSDDSDDGGAAPEYHLMVAQYVEFLFNLLDMPRPRLITDPRGAAETAENERFAVDFMRLLKDQDPELFDALLRALAEPDPEARRRGSGGAGAGGPRGAVDAVCGLVANCVERFFVGVVPFPTVLFLWDQILLAGPWIVLHLSAVYLMLLREWLLPCTSEAEARRAVAERSPSLTADAFRREMERRFMPAVRARLRLPQRPALVDPVADTPARLLDS
eukprot:tig00020961_g16696.t1